MYVSFLFLIFVSLFHAKLFCINRGKAQHPLTLDKGVAAPEMLCVGVDEPHEHVKDFKSVQTTGF